MFASKWSDCSFFLTAEGRKDANSAVKTFDSWDYNI